MRPVIILSFLPLFLGTLWWQQLFGLAWVIIIPKSTVRRTTITTTRDIGTQVRTTKSRHYFRDYYHYHYRSSLQQSIFHLRLEQASSSSSVGTTDLLLPRLSKEQLQELDNKNYIVIKNFIPTTLIEQLQDDIRTLRDQYNNKFNIAKIGQDTTNILNTNIRVAETCFLGTTKDIPNLSRTILYKILEQIRFDLVVSLGKPLDSTLSELLYAYYPRGGYYRRHRDAIPGSASTLRIYSLLLYLNNENWDTTTDGGELRLHFDNGGDELPIGEEPNYIDVVPAGGTLVLFKSDTIPHEVLDTNKERMAVVGWYNRPVSISDITELSSTTSGEVSPVRLIMLAVAAALVTVGIINILSS